jgi:hypothetical protein
MGKHSLVWLIIVVIIAVLLVYFFRDSNTLTKKDEHIFMFNMNETGESIDGEIFINNISIGQTYNGNFSMPNMAITPEYFLL